MQPEDFRSLLLAPGTPLGLFGDDDGPSEHNWARGELILCTLTSYVIIERQHRTSQAIAGEKEWDTGILSSLPVPLKTEGYDRKEYVVSQLLLVQRYPGLAWDRDDPSVHVYGILKGDLIQEEPLRLDEWKPYTVWLASTQSI